jgi:hypothetical protein
MIWIVLLGYWKGAGLIQQHKWLKDKSIIKQHYNFSEIGDSKQGKLDGCEDDLWMWSCGYAELGVQGVNGFKIKDCWVNKQYFLTIF